LNWIDEQGPDAFDLDPRLESLMPNLEAILIDKLGPEAGGQVLTGRSRGEVEAVAGVLLLRDKLLELLDEVIQLRAVLIALAAENVDTLMPGYTHLQHAQPTTLGHHLACVASALETECARLQDAYRRLDASPAEAGTSWGSSYAIDRKRVADALGFEGMIENTRYAYSSGSDKAIEIAAALAMLAVTLNRFTEDLYFWCTPEYGLAEAADEFAGTSYIMPQKKNVTALQHFTSVVNRSIAAFNRLALQAARSPFGIGTNLAVTMMASGPETAVAMDDLIGAVRLARGFVSTMTFNKALMRERAGIHFTQGTELADTLFREKGIAFRTAHRIVGALVRDALAQGKTPMQVDEAMLNKAATEVTGKRIEPPYGPLWRVLDPEGIVKAHRGVGATAPAAVRRSLANLSRGLRKDGAFARSRRARLSAARKELDRQVRRLIGRGG
jgi:argininosuccinate lyase